MSLKRRDFMKLATGTVAGFGVSQMVHPSVVEALAGTLDGSRVPVLWIQAQGCTGCSVSLLNATNPSIADVLLKVISLEFNPTVNGGEGETVINNMFNVAKKNKGKYILAVEGSIPTEAHGHYCVIGETGAGPTFKEWTAMEAVEVLAKDALVAVGVGTCSAYGGIPAAKGSVTGAKTLKQFFGDKGIKTPVVNVPGCPPHPDWIVGTIVLALEAIKAHGPAKGLAEVVKVLDENARPKPFFGKNIHDNCPYLKYFEEQKMSKLMTEKDACRYEVGCKGPSTNADCFSRQWNNKTNWCVQNAVCIGCVEPDFPDGKSPFYSS